MNMTGLFVGLIAVAAGILQGVTGMGGGLIQMLVLPLFFPVQLASAIAGCACLFLTAAMAFQYRKKANVRMAIVPALLYMAASGLAIHFSAGWNPVIIKKLLGGFLVLLALYFLVIQPKAKLKPGPVLSIVFFLVAGTCDGLFSVGSPLMVLYFLSKTEDKEEYLGSIQLAFFLSLFSSTVVRISHRILLPVHIPAVLAAIVGIWVGLGIANRIVKRIDAELFRKFVYGAIILSGIYNLVF